MTNRRTVRQVVLQALYASEISRDRLEHIRETVIDPRVQGDETVSRYAERLLNLTVRNTDELDEIIQKHIDNWKIERLAVLDKLILRMALCEFLYFEEIPTKVTINEAIELAKTFSTQKSGKFVNGILDAALEHLNKDGRIKKSGRGLIDTSFQS